MRKFSSNLIALAALLSAALGGPAIAEDDLCAHDSGDTAIAACTSDIESGRYSGHALAAKYSNRGVEWNQKKEYERALADYSNAIRHDAKYADAYYNRCITYVRKEDYDRAIADCSRAIELGPSANSWDAASDTRLSNNQTYSDYFERRGIAYHYKQDFDRAIADYTEALRLYPDNARALDNRGRAYQAKGDSKRADADFEAAKRLRK